MRHVTLVEHVTSISAMKFKEPISTHIISIVGALMNRTSRKPAAHTVQVGSAQHVIPL